MLFNDKFYVLKSSEIVVSEKKRRVITGLLLISIIKRHIYPITPHRGAPHLRAHASLSG